MSTELTRPSSDRLALATGGPSLPAVIADAGDHAAKRFFEFFGRKRGNSVTWHRGYGHLACGLSAVVHHPFRCGAWGSSGHASTGSEVLGTHRSADARSSERSLAGATTILYM